MKKMLFIIVIMFAGVFHSEAKAGYGEVNFNYFYHNLNSYGEWIEVDYDVIVWRPYNTGRNWSPYSVGNWEYTSYGWYWNSYEPFGWATYHYGRWYYDDYYGWLWVPGYEWGPSWVEWRYSDSHIGWSPLPPYADFRNRVGIYFTINYVSSYHYWNFVTYDRFCHRNVHLHYVDNYYKNRIFNNTKYRTNYYADRGRIINGGVDRNYVERRAGTRISEREIQRTTNLRDYTGSRGDANKNRVVSYQPDEREVNKYRNVEINKVNRAEGKSTLKRDAVTFRNEEKKSRDEIRNGVQTNEREPRINSDDRFRGGQTRLPVTNEPVNKKVQRDEPKVQQERKVQPRESYQIPKRTEQKVKSYTPAKPAPRETKSYNSNNNSNRNNSYSTPRNNTSSRPKSYNKPSTSKREVSKPSSSRKTSTAKKKRN